MKQAEANPQPIFHQSWKNTNRASLTLKHKVAGVHSKQTKAMCFRQTQHTSAVVMGVLFMPVMIRGLSAAHGARIAIQTTHSELPNKQPNNKGSPHPHKQTGWLMDWLKHSAGALHVRAQQELRFYLWPQFIDWCCIHLHTRNHKLSLNMMQKSIRWSSQSNQPPLIMRGVGLNDGFITHRNWHVQLEWMRRCGRQWLTFVIANQWKDDDSEMHTGSFYDI